MYYSALMEGLLSWHKAAEDPSHLELPGLLAAFVTKPEYWSMPGEPEVIHGSAHGHYMGHGHVALLRAILNYAVAANDTRLKHFVKDSYEYTRNFGIEKGRVHSRMDQ